MFKGVSFDKKLLLASVTITVIGILLPWIDIYEIPQRGVHLKYGARLLILLIISLMIVLISRKMRASILITINSSLAFLIVLQAHVEIFASTQAPSFFSVGIGVFVTELGAIGMILAGVFGIKNHRKNRS